MFVLRGKLTNVATYPAGQLRNDEVGIVGADDGHPLLRLLRYESRYGHAQFLAALSDPKEGVVSVRVPQADVVLVFEAGLEDGLYLSLRNRCPRQRQLTYCYPKNGIRPQETVPSHGVLTYWRYRLGTGISFINNHMGLFPNSDQVVGLEVANSLIQSNSFSLH